jgi:hypothetical protein
MGLEGNLKDFDLSDILQLIQMGKKTGALQVEADNDIGNIFFFEGNAVHAAATEIRGDGAVNRILRWRQGSFAFLPDVTTDQHSIQLPLQHLVLEAARQIDEWQDIQRLIPTMDIVLAIEGNPTAGTEDIKLEPVEWKMLALVDGIRTVNQIARDGHLGDFETCKVLYGLQSSGLLKQVAKPKPAPPPPVTRKPEALVHHTSRPVVMPETPKPTEPEKKGILGGLFGRKK